MQRSFRGRATATTLLAGCGLLVLAVLMIAFPAFAHTVAEGDQGYIQEITGAHVVPFGYLGAKHMVTGYDHLLFLFAVIFYLHRLRAIALYVTLFAIGHSTTMLLAVFLQIAVSAYVVDAIIGLSVVYMALDNMGAYRRWFGVQPNAKVATLAFGLVHGLGLATKIQEFGMAPDGLVANLLAFNVGIEAGQILALTAILIAMGYWRRTSSFRRHAYAANVVLLTAGLLLVGYQTAGYVLLESL